METECEHTEVTLAHFNDWLQGVADDKNPLRQFDRDKYSCYIDYKYMKDMFTDHPHVFEEVHWKDFGLTDVSGYDSTIWLGSAGANTPGHQDTYGFNLVTQIRGRKLWILFPPEDSQYLYPTRLPYEESSIFTQVNIRRPDLHIHSKFQMSQPVVVTLHPGQTLYVPRHWWHYVESLEPSISINAWIPMAEDKSSHVTEAITRCLASSLIPSLDTSQDGRLMTSWLNPTESLTPVTVNLQLLRAAVCHLMGDSSSANSNNDTTCKPNLSDGSTTCELNLPEGSTTYELNLSDGSTTCELNLPDGPTTLQKVEPQLPGRTVAKSNSVDEWSSVASFASVIESQLNPERDRQTEGPDDLLLSLARTLQSYPIRRVCTPFQIDNKMRVPAKRTSGTFSGSLIKKQKFEDARPNDAREHEDEVYAGCTQKRIFSLRSCSFDELLKVLDRMCQQVRCLQCCKDLCSQTSDRQQERGDRLLQATVPTGSCEIVSSLTCKGSQCTLPDNRQHDLRLEVDSTSQVCASHEQPASPVTGNGSQCLPSTREAVQTSDNSSNSCSTLSGGSESSCGGSGVEAEVTLCDSAELAELLLSSVLHPSVVAMVAELFKDKYKSRLKQKNILLR